MLFKFNLNLTVFRSKKKKKGGRQFIFLVLFLKIFEIKMYLFVHLYNQLFMLLSD